MIEYSESQLKLMGTIEIKKHFLSIRAQIILNYQQSIDTKELEIYYCYISKEIQNRNKKCK
jgi:hypothetical protein